MEYHETLQDGYNFFFSNLSGGGAVCAEKNVKKISDLPPRPIRTKETTTTLNWPL
jgi:hypothetical protein